MVSMKDISAVCGVSIATVSKALNNHKDIGEETKEHIRQVAKEMGYSPNAAAKILKTNRTYSLGVLFVDDGQSGLTHDYFAHVLDSFKRTAEERGYDITFINSCKTRSQRMSYLEHSRYRRFDGVVIACVDFEDPEVEELVRSNIPVVTIDHLFNNRSTILSDNVKGISDLVHYIYEMGHRKIAYIHGADSAVTQSRLSSFYRTCEELGIKYTGGKNSPYIWLKCPGGLGSWEFFDYLLNEIQVVGTPGEGFGPNGKGWFRLTAFGTKENTVEAMNRLKSLLKE